MTRTESQARPNFAARSLLAFPHSPVHTLDRSVRPSAHARSLSRNPNLATARAPAMLQVSSDQKLQTTTFSLHGG